MVRASRDSECCKIYLEICLGEHYTKGCRFRQRGCPCTIKRTATTPIARARARILTTTNFFRK